MRSEIKAQRVIVVEFWAYSSVGLEHSPDKGKVSGSNPLRPTR